MKVFRFKSFELAQSKMVMPLTTDAILLGSWVQLNGGSVLDVGTGTGIISLMLAQRFPEIKIHAIDNDPDAIETAARNFRNSPWANRIGAELMDFNAVKTAGYDHIVSNPPFFENSFKSPNGVKTKTRHSNPDLSPGALISKAPHLLSPEGTISLIALPEARDGLLEQAESVGLQCRRTARVRPTPAKECHRILLEFKWSATPGEGLMEEVVIKTREGKYTDQFAQLTGDFYL